MTSCGMGTEDKYSHKLLQVYIETMSVFNAARAGDVQYLQTSHLYLGALFWVLRLGREVI